MDNFFEKNKRIHQIMCSRCGRFSWSQENNYDNLYCLIFICSHCINFLHKKYCKCQGYGACFKPIDPKIKYKIHDEYFASEKAKKDLHEIDEIINKLKELKVKYQCKISEMGG